MTVNRKRPLPMRSLRGHFEIAQDLILKTRTVLYKFYSAGRHEGGHEGICFWAGREKDNLTTLEKVLIPIARHGRFGVFVTEKDFGEVARQARSIGLGILAQVHSHPGYDTRHSDGDDELIMMPFENMLSLVAPYYGLALQSINDFSIHQYQDRRWVLCDSASISSAFETACNH